jgi:glycosyltransferase involved in cell wall biosynthesis
MNRVPVRPRILCIAHGTIEKNSGGVEVYQRVVAEKLRDRFEFLFFAPDLNSGNKGSYLLYSLESNLRVSLKPQPPVKQEHSNHPGLENIFSEILREYRISLVHFHHLLRQVPSLPGLSRAMGVPTVFSVHDYYPVCDEYNLLDSTGQYCGVLEKGFINCDSCLYLIRGYKLGSQKKRITQFSRALLQSDRVIFNTQGNLKHFQKLFSELDEEKMRVVGAPSGTVRQPSNPRSLEGNLRVLIPNGLSHLKGGKILCELLDQTRELPIEYHFFGKTDRGFSEEAIRRSNPQVQFHGHYSREELTRFSAGIHLSLHASIWPETFCIALSEMWDLGVVPIASKIGALAERIRDGENGFLVPPGNAEALKMTLLRVLENREEVERIRARLTPELSTAADECSSRIESIYKEVLKTEGAISDFVVQRDAGDPDTWSTGKGPKSRWLRKWLNSLGLSRFALRGPFG